MLSRIAKTKLYAQSTKTILLQTVTEQLIKKIPKHPDKSEIESIVSCCCITPKQTVHVGGKTVLTTPPPW